MEHFFTWEDMLKQSIQRIWYMCLSAWMTVQLILTKETTMILISCWLMLGNKDQQASYRTLRIKSRKGLPPRPKSKVFSLRMFSRIFYSTSFPFNDLLHLPCGHAGFTWVGKWLRGAGSADETVWKRDLFGYNIAEGAWLIQILICLLLQITI